MNSLFNHFWKTIIEANRKNGRWEPDFNRKSFATIKFYVKKHHCELLIKLYKKEMTNHGTNDVQRVLQTTT